MQKTGTIQAAADGQITVRVAGVDVPLGLLGDVPVSINGARTKSVTVPNGVSDLRIGDSVDVVVGDDQCAWCTSVVATR